MSLESSLGSIIVTLRNGKGVRSRLQSIFCLIGICLLVVAPQCSLGQVAQGVPPFSTPDAHQYDTINLADLSIVITVPVRSKAAEPIPFSYSLQMDNYIYEACCGGLHGTTPFWTANAAMTGTGPGDFNPNTGGNGVGYSSQSSTCSNGTATTLYIDWIFTDRFLQKHSFTGLEVDSKGCIASNASATAQDASGYTLVVSSLPTLTSTVYDVGGNSVQLTTKYQNSSYTIASSGVPGLSITTATQNIVSINETVGCCDGPPTAWGLITMTLANALSLPVGYGDKVQIAGVAVSGYDGACTIQTVSTNGKTVTCQPPASATLSPSSGGTVTAGLIQVTTTAANDFVVGQSDVEISNAGNAGYNEAYGEVRSIISSTELLLSTNDITTWQGLPNSGGGTLSGIQLAGPPLLIDPNGNVLQTTESMNWETGVETYGYQDPLGQVPLTYTLGGPNYFSPTAAYNPDTYTYTYKTEGGTSQNANITVNYAEQTLYTDFGPCNGILNTQRTLPSFAVPSTVTLPDGSSFSFTYETTPGQSFPDTTGRVASMVLPTGGTISYKYSGGAGGDGLNCDGTTNTLTRTTPDGAWTYVHTPTNGSTPSTTTVTDPAGNQTTYTFSGIYQTGRQVSQLINGTQTLLESWIICYNGNFANCNTTATVTPPIMRRDAYRTPANGQTALSEVLYNTNGMVVQQNEFDYGVNTGAAPTATPLRGTLIAYASPAPFINNRPSCVQVTAGSNPTTCGTPAANTVALTNYLNYNSHGKIGTIQKWVSGIGSSAAYLSSSFTYNANGTVATSTDVNSALTTYYYNGTGECNDLLLTSVVYPVDNLSTSQQWDCNGDVVTSVKDVDGQVTSFTYSDPFWRITSSTDPLLNVTNYVYSPFIAGSSVPYQSNTLSFNGGMSISGQLNYMDGLGRVVQSQVQQAPGSKTYDTVSYTYDTNGRPYSTSMPCAVAANTNCPITPETTHSYDALNRPLVTTDGGGGTLTRGYPQNDVLRIVGPPPSGENAKQRQSQYDALGRLTSVCEVTGLPGSGTCSQASSKPTGYFTTYTYDSPANTIKVTQNAQGTPQTRTYQYDGLGRLTSEQNPETGTTTYTYDTNTTCGTSMGDLVKKVDAVGNVICNAFDGLHRKTSVTHPTGTYASVTADSYFVYDSATVDGAAMQNTAGLNAEAYTVANGTGASGTKLTDEGFSYDADGRLAGVYQSTPNSGGYYNTMASYWANGALNTLSGVPGLSGWTFTPDGEGRPSSATYNASPVVDWVTGTAYYPSDPQTTVTFGNGDNDVYTYDLTTGRMSGFQFTVGTTPTTLSSTVGWNKDWTLGSFGITDGFNASNTQNCSYVHDDLARINSVNCGTNGSTNNVWSQSFTLDPFGNVSKSGSSSFAASYLLANGTTNNQEQSVGTCVPTYDANGNLTKDCAFSTPYTYVWNADDKPTTLDGKGITYDALGREVEFASGSTHTQILYSALGKLAVMNGQTPKTTRIPLPGGSTAEILGTGGTRHTLHSDWLGSSRLSTAYINRTLAYDVGYAPYGESYVGSGSSADLNFTGQSEDTLSGLYDFLYREYSPVQGRWISPDPAGTAVANFSNPQSLNRYSYVSNNPLASVDPLGLDCFTDPSCGDGPPDWGDEGDFYGWYYWPGPRGNQIWLFSISAPLEVKQIEAGIDAAEGTRMLETEGLLPGEDCLYCYPVGANPLAILQAVLSGNIWGALQGVGAIPQDPNCEFGACGDSFPGAMNATPANLPSLNPQAVLDCYNGFHNSRFGRGVEFFSLLSLTSVDQNYKRNWWDTLTFGLGKASTVGAAGRFGKGLLKLGAEAAEVAASGLVVGATTLDGLVLTSCLPTGINIPTAPSIPGAN